MSAASAAVGPASGCETMSSAVTSLQISGSMFSIILYKLANVGLVRSSKQCF